MGLHKKRRGFRLLLNNEQSLEQSQPTCPHLASWHEWPNLECPLSLPLIGFCTAGEKGRGQKMGFCHKKMVFCHKKMGFCQHKILYVRKRSCERRLCHYLSALLTLLQYRFCERRLCLTWSLTSISHRESHSDWNVEPTIANGMARTTRPAIMQKNIRNLPMPVWGE